MDEQNAAKLRRIVEKVVSRPVARGYTAGHVLSDVVESVKGAGFDVSPEDGGSVILEYWCHLLRTGCIAIPAVQYSPKELPAFILTERGRRSFASGDAGPHDRHRYLDRLSQGRKLDGVVRAYVSEAIAAWEQDLPRASVAMLGGACERLVVLLAEALAARTELGGGCQKIAVQLAGDRAPGASALLRLVEAALGERRRDLPVEVADGIGGRLAALAGHVRAMRNEAGHPTADRTVTMDDAHSGLVVFPRLCAFVYDTIDAVAALP